MPTSKSPASAAANSAYDRGQKAANAHTKAAKALRALQRRIEKGTDDGTSAKALAAWDLSETACALDLAFPQDGREEAEDREAAHRTRAAVLLARRQDRVLARYRGSYKDTTAASGHKSKNNGDAVAIALAGAEPLVVVAAAERLAGLAEGELLAKYAKLNPGQQRMNSGNRIRNLVKKGIVSVEQVVEALQ